MVWKDYQKLKNDTDIVVHRKDGFMRTIDEEVVMTKDKLVDLYELIEDAVKRNGQVLFDDHLQRLDYLQLKLIGKGDLWITNLYWKDENNNIYNPVLEKRKLGWADGWYVVRNMNLDWSGSGRTDMFRKENRYI